MSRDLSLLENLLDRQPRVPILGGPTPVRRLSSAFPSSEAWLKDDSRTHPVYGGNKPRKLEYLLATARPGRERILTFGFESSNHALATAYHCRENGLGCQLVLVRGPEGLCAEDARMKDKKLALVRDLGAQVKTVPGFRTAFASALLSSVVGIGRIRVIPPGGSSALGTLGYVRAGVELAAQVARGELPPPENVYVALGTSGTAVGLAIGLKAAGLNAKVVAVKVVPGLVNEPPRLRRLAQRARKLLPGLPVEYFDLQNLEVDATALGEGYGAPTPEALRAVARWLDEEGVRLEATYTGKAAAAMERRLSRSSGPQLFWQTFSDYRG